MTVSELRTLLADQPDHARVLIFDTPREGRTDTLAVNCLLAMNHNGPIVILNHDSEEALRIAEFFEADTTATSDFEGSDQQTESDKSRAEKLTKGGK